MKKRIYVARDVYTHNPSLNSPEDIVALSMNTVAIFDIIQLP